jgi:hypothetical protein
LPRGTGGDDKFSVPDVPRPQLRAKTFSCLFGNLCIFTSIPIGIQLDTDQSLIHEPACHQLKSDLHVPGYVLHWVVLSQ